MRAVPTSTLAALGTALLLLTLPVAEAFGHGGPHASLARKHMHHQNKKLAKRTQCEFPTDAGLVAVTPNEQNAGWAMSPNQPCEPGMYCPYACPPGQLMAQWNPEATSYSYPMSMDGGLYCNANGEIEKPFPNKPYCNSGVGNVACKNEAAEDVALCQTVLPGNEAMLIPTNVQSSSIIAVPDTSYWASTAAHYYINPPGISTEEACVWGTSVNPYGNWAPYVAGANQADTGDTFVKIGWNPIYIQPDVPFRDVMPDWGVRIDCEGGECNGLPCYIDPNEQGVNEVSSNNAAGAGGATFCVVTVPQGASATITVFSKSGGSSSSIEIESTDNSASSGDTTIVSSSSSSVASSSSSTSSTPVSTSTSQTPTSTSISQSSFSTSSASSTSSSSTSSNSSSSSSSSSSASSSSSSSASSSSSPSASSSSQSSSSSSSQSSPSSSSQSASSPWSYVSATTTSASYSQNSEVPAKPQVFVNANATTTNSNGTYSGYQPAASPAPTNNFTYSTETPVAIAASSATALTVSSLSAMAISAIAALFVIAL
ncbi:hypothetical protein RUND412_000468 [Rhizina undulata]